MFAWSICCTMLSWWGNGKWLLKHHFIYLIWTQGLTVSKTSSSLYSRLWIKAWYWPCITMYCRLWKNCNVTKPMTHDHPILLTVKCLTWRLFLAANFRPYRAKNASNARGMPGERRGGGGGGGVIDFLGTDKCKISQFWCGCMGYKRMFFS